MNPNIDNFEFLQQVFNGLPEDETPAICAFPEDPGEVRAWPVYPPSSGHVRRQLEDGDSNTFFCISSVKKVESGRLSRQQNALSAVYVFPLDDIGFGEGSKYSPEDVPLRPSYALETSPGNFQYGYLPSRPVENMAEARALLKLMSRDVGDSAASVASKLIRLPVGVNNKAKYGTPFNHKLHVFDSSRRYSLEELREAFSITDEEFEQTVEEFGEGEAGTPAAGTPTDDIVYDWLAHAGYLSTSTPADGRGWITMTCPWADEHTNGSDKASYSPIGCGGDFATARQWKCQHEHCQDRTHVDVIQLMFDKRYVYGERDNVVFDRLRPGRSLALQNFHNTMLPMSYYRKGSQKPLHFSREWLASVTRDTVYCEGLAPGEDRITKDRKFNTFLEYREQRLTVATDKLPLILEQLKYLFGDQLDNALSFLAWTYWRPEVRIQFAMLHIAKHHGTGRGWLKQLIQRMFAADEDYVAFPKFDDLLDGNYNEFIQRSLVCIFDEIHTPRKRYRVGDKLREFITESRQQVNVKYGFKGDVAVNCNVILLSNNKAALRIPDEDRRIWAVMHNKEPLSEEHYNKIYELLEDREAIRQFASYLYRHLQSSTWNPKGRAPHTQWRDDVRAAGEDPDFDTPIREVIAELREQGVKAIWRQHLLQLCQRAGADVDVRFHGRDKRGYRFEQAVLERGLHRSKDRVKVNNVTRKHLGASLSSGTGKLHVYVFDEDLTEGLAKHANDLLEHEAATRVDALPEGIVALKGKRDLLGEGDNIPPLVDPSDV